MSVVFIKGVMRPVLESSFNERNDDGKQTGTVIEYKHMQLEFEDKKTHAIEINRIGIPKDQFIDVLQICNLYKDCIVMVEVEQNIKNGKNQSIGNRLFSTEILLVSGEPKVKLHDSVSLDHKVKKDKSV